MFQSCTIYKSTSVTLEEAANKPIKTRVETKNQEKFHFKYISYENGSYYGVIRVEGEIEKIKLNEEDVDSIQLKNGPASTTLTVLFPIGVIVFALVVFQDSYDIEI